VTHSRQIIFFKMKVGWQTHSHYLNNNFRTLEKYNKIAKLLQEPFSVNYEIDMLLNFSKVMIILGSAYFAIRGKSAAGAILPLGEPDWFNW